MANQTSGNPWVLDTANCNVTLTNARVKITGIRWVGATVAAARATLTDGSCHTIWTSLAGGSSYVEADHLQTNRLYTGLVLTILHSGTLYVEFG